MKLQEVTQIPFPAVTICYDINDWKWPGIVNAMVEFDKTNKIGNLYEDNTYVLTQKITTAELAFKKSDEYSTLLKMNDMEIIETMAAKEYQELAKFVHYVIFNEQNATSSYYLKQYLVKVRKEQLGLKINNKPNEVTEKLVSKLCNVSYTYYINASQYCPSWNKGVCSDETQVEDSVFDMWCKECFDKNCIGKSIYFTKMLLIFMILGERYINSQNILDGYVTAQLDLKYEENLSNLDDSIKWNGITALLAWSYLNGGKEEINDDVFLDILKDQTVQTKLDQESLMAISNLFSKPDIHGDNQKDYAIIPLCSFGSNDMKKCNLFQNPLLNLNKKRCFTFNGNSSSYYQGGKIGQDFGLNMLLSFRIPRDIKGALSQKLFMILHEPGEAADLLYKTNTFQILEPGFHYIVGTDATVMEITESFKELSQEKRKCGLSSKSGTYHETNCNLQKLIDFGIKKCKCLPWYMHFLNGTNDICVGEDVVCFEQVTRDEATQKEVQKECPTACKFIKYSTNVKEKKALKRELYNYDQMKADALGGFLEDQSFETYPYQSVLQINFAGPYATEITQDAKVTFADMVGSIGGTFGVFLGLSFVSLVDEMADWILWLKKAWCKN